MHVDVPSWATLPARLWFLVKTLAVRGRFITGKASFVRAQTRQTTSAVADLYDRQGRPLGSRRLAQHRLETSPPRTGTQGWELFARETRPGSRGRSPLVRLECGFCGHLFFLAIPAQPRVAQPASYTARWFSFIDRAVPAKPSLSCPRCEQKCVPRVQYLAGT